MQNITPHRAVAVSRAGIACCVLLAMLVFAAPAPAKVVYKYVYNGTYPSSSINGTGSVPGDHVPWVTNSSLGTLDIDQQANSLYASAYAESTSGQTFSEIFKFDLAGAPQPFSALAPNTRILNLEFDERTQIAVDNSGTATQGRIYYVNERPASEEVRALLPSGEPYLGGNFPVKGFPDLQIQGIAVAPDGNFWVAASNTFTHTPQGSIREYSPLGYPTGRVIYPRYSNGNVNDSFGTIGIDSQGRIYAAMGFPGGGGLAKFDSNGAKYRGPLDATFSATSDDIAIDRSTDSVFVAGGTVRQYDFEGGLVGSFGQPEGSAYPGNSDTTGVAVDEDTHIVYVSSLHFGTPSGRMIDSFIPTEPKTVPTARTLPSPEITPTTAVLRGVVNADGIDTTNCYFEWSVNIFFGNTVPCAEGNVFGANSGDHEVHAEIGGLTKGTEYHFRLVAKNSNGVPSRGAVATFGASSPPTLTDLTAVNVDTGGAQLRATVDPNGSETSYQFEWGTEAGIYTHKLPTLQPPEGFLNSSLAAQVIQHELTGLSPSSSYHFRLVARNDAGVTASEDFRFNTFPTDPETDPCENTHVRQQTGARLLLDCRAYELVSAANAGGYDVESDLVPGQTPLISPPGAHDKVLYSTFYGSIPGLPGSPTSFGHDPYVASRGPNGWSTEYVGLPADGMTDQNPYGSPLLGSDVALSEFAFGGADICNPCFSDGSTNIPLRLADGSITQGMTGSPGSESPGPANPTGQVEKPFSDDGSHFVFGSEKRFEPAGNDGSLSIYDRNLDNGSVQVVSTLPGGATMTGSGIAQLDISSDGSRILIGKLVGTDGEGNQYFDLFMHIDTDPSSVEVADTANGVIYNGMTSDGTRVFFTTADQMDDDTDTSPDLFRADVGPAGAAVSRVSAGTGGTGNTDVCTPITEWNVVSGGPNCGTLAFAGGAGVASEDGTVYFLSPEKLDGAANGIQDQPNLYVVRPGEPNPRFVALLDSSLVKPPPSPPNHPVATASLVGGLASPESMDVDQSNGDIYVFERTGGGKVSRYTSAGAPHNYTAGPFAGTNKITGMSNSGSGTFQVAVDNSVAGPFSGGFYATRGSEVDVFASTGEKLGSLNGFGLPCGVAIDPSNGAVYVGDAGTETIWRFAPVSGSTPVTTANYTKTGLKPGMFSCRVAADNLGHVYASAYLSGPLKVYDAADFSAVPPTETGVVITSSSTAMAIDPSNDNLYVNGGTEITRYDPSGNLIQAFGGGSLASSKGVAINQVSKHVYAPNGANIVDFGVEPIPYEPIDNTAIVHAVDEAGTHSYGDFQVTPNGDFAALATVVPLTGYPTGKHSEIYRYDAEAKTIHCASCPPSNVTATSDTFLSPYGLSLSDDGRVFFTTEEQLVLKDTNGKKDAYEWKDGASQLISTGIIRQGAGMLTVSADGVNAYFFTSEVLTADDQNGNSLKIYDAREGGGYPSLPDHVPCAASDECHGPGSEVPPPPDINTVTGAGATSQPVGRPCRKGFVRRRGRCLKRKPKVKRHKKRHQSPRDGRASRRNG